MIEWNPVTIKRWRRFRHMRRAWWSLWILTAMYLISLVAEVICNNTPLLVRFDGHYYAPLIRFYPEDTFLHNGRQTRPDYKQIQSQAPFRGQPGNYMIFPPIPYGPYENVPPASIPLPEAVTLAFRPEPHVAARQGRLALPEFRKFPRVGRSLRLSREFFGRKSKLNSPYQNSRRGKPPP